MSLPGQINPKGIGKLMNKSENLRHLFVLNVTMWEMGRWIRFRDYDESINPDGYDNFLFADEKQAREYAKNFKGDDSTYYEVCLMSADISEEDILEASGFETMEEFDKALATPYTPDGKNNYAVAEKAAVCKEIIFGDHAEEWIEVNNYDIDKSIEGSIVVVWSWQTHVGYARKCAEIRYATSEETEANCTKEDMVFRNQMDVVLKKEQIEGMPDADIRQLLIQELLDDRDWKWTNPQAVVLKIHELV